MNLFSLHPRLAADTVEVARLSLCRVLLMKDAGYPWLVLVPERAGVREMHELTPGDQQALMAEITAVSRLFQRLVRADKMNVAALGNMVPQLHIHIIARYEDDAAWPGPVWGAAPAVPYDDETLAARLADLRAHLNNL